MLLFVDLFVFLLTMRTIFASDYTNKNHTMPETVQNYPMKSVFRKGDLIDHGCVVFIKDCPNFYKQHIICARHYDGQYRNFNNYCEMEYENCNSWRQWSMIKRSRC